MGRSMWLSYTHNTQTPPEEKLPTVHCELLFRRYPLSHASEVMFKLETLILGVNCRCQLGS